MKTCQHCQAELTNARAKNCPDCTTILSDAYTTGAYGFVMEAITIAKADGLTGDAMRDAMQSAMKVGQSKRSEWMAEYRKAQEAKAAEQSAKIAQYRQTGRWTTDQAKDDDVLADLAEINRRRIGTPFAED